MIRRVAIALCLSTLAACGPSALTQCRIQAVEKLPHDPLSINGHDVSNLVARLQNCKVPQGADAGAR